MVARVAAPAIDPVNGGVGRQCNGSGRTPGSRGIHFRGQSEE
jgi:hypothetical protein